MPVMKKEDIKHLATLSRIRLSDDELAHFESELSSIMAYVSEVSKMAADESEAAPAVGAVYNVFRTDKITNQPNEYTEDIMAEMPHTNGRFLSVKKILQTDN